MRERSEEYCRQLQMEARSRTTSDLGSSSSLGVSSDASRLELERLEVSFFGAHFARSPVVNRRSRFDFGQVQFSEKYNQQQGRFNVELVALREQLNEAETHKELLQRELQQVREKLDASRIESMNDSEETLSELRKRHDHEMQIVMDDNQKLISELEMLSEQNRRFHTERLQTDSEYEELRTKRSAILQWERQISEVIPYISDKNDALAFLQALASKMGEELEFMKHSSKLF